MIVLLSTVARKPRKDRMTRAVEAEHARMGCHGARLYVV